MCVCACVFKGNTRVHMHAYTHMRAYIHTHTLVCTESLSLELMHKKLVATKCYQGGELGVER